MERDYLFNSPRFLSNSATNIGSVTNNQLEVPCINCVKHYKAQRCNSLPVMDQRQSKNMGILTRCFRTSKKGIVGKCELSINKRKDSGYSDINRRDSNTSTSTSTCSSQLSDDDRRDSGCSGLKTKDARTSSGFNLSGSFDFPCNIKYLVCGAEGVGKTALISQFTSSPCGHTESDELTTAVSVILNGEESLLDIEERCNVTTDVIDDADAYIVVYSCTDRTTFESAKNTAHFLRESCSEDKTILMVANKIDLARKRTVTHQEGCQAATSFQCKYIETSVALNHNVDEVLVGVLSQIRQKSQKRLLNTAPHISRAIVFRNTLHSALRTLFHGKKSSGCEKLFV